MKIAVENKETAAISQSVFLTHQKVTRTNANKSFSKTHPANADEGRSYNYMQHPRPMTA